MRDPVVTLYVVVGLLAVAGPFLASRRHGSRIGLLLAGVNAGLWAVAVLAYPANTHFHPAKAQSWIFDIVATAVVIVVNAAVILSTRLGATALGGIRRRPWIQRAGVAVLASLLPLAVLEWTATNAVKAGLAKQFVPTETRLAENTEDWRLHHVMSDDYREPDPLLLWRPVARAPYGSERFRGPDVEVPKPDGLTRVMCYGDSNTDGPPEGQPWPNDLNAILKGDTPRTEVVNAGVTGYSSYQGLQRFREDVGVYDPDVVLVSFGWNDVTQAIGGPDRTFAASGPFRSVNPTWVRVRRLLLKYKSVLVAERYLAPPAVDAEAVPEYAPRVSLDDYAANLNAFVATARAHGATPVLLTRPYRESTEELESESSWRRLVPAYNREVMEIAQSVGALVVDVQAAFAGRKDLFIDQCHFTPEGHRVMAQLVADRLRGAGVVR
jgi:lysophospholipase L1-like esterase